MALKPTRQIKDSRPIPIDPQDHADVFCPMQPGTIYPVPPAERDKILPADYPGRTTVEVAGSGVGFGGHAVEQIVSATKDGKAIHKTYRYTFETLPDGRIVRRDVTHDYSSPSNGQVNDHHQDPQDTKDRLSGWAGFESL